MDNEIDKQDLIRRAIAESGHLEASMYESDRAYPNPLDDCLHGKSQNAYMANSGLVPPNTVQFLKSFETVASGVAVVTENSLANLYEYNGYEACTADIIGVIRDLSCRFGVGAEAEIFAEAVLESLGESVQPSQEGDENNRVDIRTDRATYQVKLAEEYRTDWPYPDELIWVIPGGRAYLKVDGRGMDGWEPLI